MKKTASTFKTIIIIVAILAIIGMVMRTCDGGETNKSSGEVRCWYCSKVIVNSEGRMIHCTHKSANSYVCDYCGKTNVIK